MEPNVLANLFVGFIFVILLFFLAVILYDSYKMNKLIKKFQAENKEIIRLTEELRIAGEKLANKDKQ